MAKKKKIYSGLGLSSMQLWLYLDGNMDKRVRAGTDANCNVHYKGIKRINGCEVAPLKKRNYLEYSKKHVVKIRVGWNGTLEDDSFYGDLKLKPIKVNYALLTQEEILKPKVK